MTVRRLLPPLGAVGAVVLVIVLLLVLNNHSAKPGAGPAIVSPPGSASVSPSASASPVESSAAPSVSPTVPAPPASEPPATTPPSPTKVPVTVLNNSRHSGLGHEVANELRAKGWPIADIGNYRGRLSATTAFYPPGQLAAAQELAREFPQIRRIEPRFAGLPGHGLTLVVTRDWTA